MKTIRASNCHVFHLTKYHLRTPRPCSRQRRPILNRLFLDYNGICQSCLKPVNRTEKDNLCASMEHLMPRCLRGSNEMFNLSLYCKKCNERCGKFNIKKRMKFIMKKLFEIENKYIIGCDVMIDGQKQIIVMDMTGSRLGSTNGAITVPIRLQDIQMKLGRPLLPDEVIINPRHAYTQIVWESGKFEDTTWRLMFKYQDFHIWKYIHDKTTSGLPQV